MSDNLDTYFALKLKIADADSAVDYCECELADAMEVTENLDDDRRLLWDQLTRAEREAAMIKDMEVHGR